MTINKLLKHKKGLMLSLINEKGFTLIETLVAITILILSVVGPISLIGDAVHKLYYVRDKVIAINLAHEGVEAVRQVRDNNLLAGSVWNTGLMSPGYIVDIGGPSLLSACSGCDQKVYLDPITNLYRQGVGFSASTQFSRIITISSTGLGADERNVTATVTWKTGSDVGNISVSENIFDFSL